MIRQHYLQQERLKQNHERLLQRYQRILTPPISEFRPFGASALPGRNYQQYLTAMNGKPSLDGNPLAIFSRQRIVSNNREIDRWVEKEKSESLPKNVNASMQHTRHQSIPLVEAEKFEPVMIYNHPVFGPTPAYIKPIFKDNVNANLIKDESSDSDSTEDDNTIVNNVQKKETKNNSENTDADKENDSDDSDENAPIGYISHKKWKAKYQNLVPVNPLLFSIHTQRSNESIQSYGRSLYSSLNHLQPRRQRQLSDDDMSSTRTTLSDVESNASDIKNTAASSSSSTSRYNRLNPTAMSRPVSSVIKEESSEDESDDDHNSDARIPYLSKNITALSTSTSTTLNEPIKPIFSTTLNSSDGITITPPAAPPLPPPLSIEESKSAPTNIPKAPPLPPSLTGASSYQNPSNLPTNGTLSNSVGVYQATSSVSGAGSTTGPTDTSKTVTFPNNLAPATPSAVDLLSSSDSDDDRETKKLKRRQKRKAAGVIDADSSSSDD